MKLSVHYRYVKLTVHDSHAFMEVPSILPQNIQFIDNCLENHDNVYTRHIFMTTILFIRQTLTKQSQRLQLSQSPSLSRLARCLKKKVL